MAEGAFAITNPGVFGGLMGLPVINQPNVAILGLGGIQKRATVVSDAIAIRSMACLTLSYDHRVVDGAVAHQFMAHIKKVPGELDRKPFVGSCVPRPPWTVGTAGLWGYTAVVDHDTLPS